MLEKIRHGRIIIKDQKETRVFGPENELQATLRVYSPAFYRRVLFGGTVGTGETYVEHIWEVDDLTRLIQIMVRNLDVVDTMDMGIFTWLLLPFRLVSHALKNNSRKGARKNIISHYDLGNELYEAFLDPAMMYSSAIFPNPKSSLDEAARHKLDVICKKLRLSPQDHVVEIGSGWGGFAIHAAKHYGCRVTTTTISDAQYQEAARRIKMAGLSERITLLKKDYRELTGQYDKLVSIEMIEAVGHRYLPTFFKKCGELLKKDGMMLLQAITISDQKYEQYVRSVDFIQRHIFPGGCLPSNKRMISLLADKTDMVVRSLEDYGHHYARTLQEWRHRFNASFSELQRYGFDERFRRMWEFYFCYCEGGFRERSISVVHVTATRPRHREPIEQL